jgi:hypothetical protein
MALDFVTNVCTGNNFTGSGSIFGLPHNSRYRILRRARFDSLGINDTLSSGEVLANPSVNGHAILFDSVFSTGFFSVDLGDFNNQFLQITNQRGAAADAEAPKFSDFGFNNTANSMLLVASGRGRENRLSFRDLFLEEWKSTIDAELGGDAERDGDPVLTWTMFPENISFLNPGRRYLQIYQRLNIELDWWPDYDAWIKYHVHLSVSNGTVIGGVHRWAYWVEGGIKSGAIGDRLKPAVISGMATLNAKLAERLPLISLFGRVTDLYYLPGRQVDPIAPVVRGSTNDDVTIVVEFAE